MVVIYDIDSKIVLASLKGNCCYSIKEKSDVLKMYPGINVDLLSIDSSDDIVGCDIIFEEGIPISIKKINGDIIRFSSEEINKKYLNEKEKMMSLSKFRVDDNFKILFNDFVSNSRHIDDSTKKTVDNGSFFKKINTVGWWGSFLDAGGYANMNREIVSRLFCHNIVPITDIYPTIAQVDKKTECFLKSLSLLKPNDSRYKKVYAFTPMPHSKHGGKSIFFTMMETSTLHADFSRYCNLYSDEVWVPSLANADLFRVGGVRKPIKVVPLGIDEKLYSSPKGEVDLSVCKGVYGRPVSEGIGKFKFLSVIQWNYRKGYDALIRSFLKAFNENDDVCLVIATQYSLDIVKSTLDKYIDRRNNLPQVILYNNIISIENMPFIYDSCDCYVHLSRGEGFSLTQIEAAARGLPVISCCHSGMTEYLREDNSFPIECKRTESCNGDLSSMSYFYAGQKIWKVSNEQVEQASCYMSSIANGREDYASKCDVFKREVFDKYTWKSAVKRIASLLQ